MYNMKGTPSYHTYNIIIVSIIILIYGGLLIYVNLESELLVCSAYAYVVKFN